ncbi:uncharacterized protein M421DRAFT_418748 [Didymella exigua CBS 183.55]|uniref:Zn(2)-C6 fungal-type domain-containing protein n=1 Tax=Didymella exigua CBS 183.55 TaxID=1150837 RepID=A0A6A5RSL3_9PLEO|nr:uncharacterized protein M421DRAFT_418748 [Didymella exigua CBS 183.55]KAF1930423.1 hypothetical protein M421DRAFT_418748 [Didymella exigua CBS 183.55]
MSTPATPNGSTRNAGSVTSGRISKNPKACEECHRRKQKCDGRTPCSVCTRRNSRCSYRSYIRQRVGRASLTNRDAQVTHNTDEPCDHGIRGAVIAPSTGDRGPALDGLPRSMPPRLAIFNNIRATQNTSRGRTELFYGASSPFSVLQHLDAHLPMQGTPAVYPSPDGEEVQNGDRSIKS